MAEQSIRILRDDDHVRLEVDEGRSMIRSIWKGYVPSPDYRSILLQLLELIKAEHLSLWMSDSTRMGVILRSDEVWSIKTFTPMLQDAGLRRVAVVRSADFFSQTASERMAEASSGKVPYMVEFFNSALDADNWLAKELKSLI